MVQVTGQLVEFCSRRLLLQLRLLQQRFLCKLLQLLPDFLVLGLNVLKVALSRVEIVLVLAAVEASEVFLNDFGLLIEKLALLFFVLMPLLPHKYATADVTSPDPLYLEGGFLLVVELPLYLEHAEELLDPNCCRIFLVFVLFCLI